VFSNATGNSGDLIITTGSLSVTDGSQLQASTRGQGNAGSVIIEARDHVWLDGDTAVFSSVERTGRGKGGDIRITTGTLLVTNGAQLISSTSGQGHAGNVIIEASDRVFFDGRSSDGTFGSDVFSRVERTGRGQGGDIRITTGTLSVTNGAQLVADTRGQGNAGNVIIAAREQVWLDGNKSDAFSNVERNGRGKGGDIRITTGTLSVTNGAQLQASSRGQGNAGNVIIAARERVSFEKGYAFSSLEQSGRGKGGDIRITSRALSLTNGAQLSASTRGQGDAGSIIIDARERVWLDGNNTSAFSNVTQIGRGQGGDIRITTEELELTNGGGLIASSRGEGKAGDVEVSAGSIRLDGGGISSETASGDGGNIALSIQNILLLRRGSLISTTAGTASAAGNGGNITINTPFIVAVPLENSDITANAFTGKGGNIQITAQGIFGIQFRGQQTPLSDITASSKFGVDGVVELNTPDVDPSQGLATLPVELVDVSGLIAQGCPAGGGTVGQGQSEFIITGRGGLPPSPSETLRSDAVRVNSAAPTVPAANRSVRAIASQPPRPTTVPLVEAQGWATNAKGEVVLTAAAPTLTTHSPWLSPTGCLAPKNPS
jgi:large exoprotein involved in heme utilization and adhesion